MLFPAPVYRTGAGPVFLATGDLDGDGWPDLVTSNQRSLDGTLLRSRGGGTFSIESAFALPGESPGAFTVGRIDTDSLDDIVVVVGGYKLSTILSRSAYPYPIEVTPRIASHIASVAIGEKLEE